MSDSDAITLYCDSCINFKLAQLKKSKEQKDREEKLRAEQEQIEYNRRIAQLESEALAKSRQALKSETQRFAKHLEDKHEEKKKRFTPETSQITLNNSNYEFENARLKYREELLGQMSEKRDRKSQQERAEREAERRRLEDLEVEKQRQLREMTVESLIQKESYRRMLSDQISLKKSQKDEEFYQKQVEKALLDEEIRKYKEEQMRLISLVKRNGKPGYLSTTSEKDNRSECSGESHDEHASSCSHCKRMLPLQALSRFPS